MIEQPKCHAPDPIDAASLHSIADTAKIVQMHANRFKPAAEYDLAGNKVCIECGDIIPTKRAEIELVVRCLPCQTISDKLT